MAKKDKDLEFGFMGEVYITPIKHIDHTDLTYWEDNPRIYNKIRRKTEESPIIQKEIQNFFFSKDVAWTRELMALIIKATRVNEPLFVQFSEETKTYVVYEGNTRLAAVRRILQDNINHKVPNDLPCRIIPPDVDQGVINAIVGQAHLKGKKDWDAFEANSYLYREFIYRKEQGATDQEIYVSLKGEFGVAQSKVKNAIKTFEFMNKYNLTETHWGVDKYSHWEEYNKLQAYQTFNFFNDIKQAESAGIKVTQKDAFDKAIIKMVKSPSGPISYRLKEDLRLIGKATETGNFEPIESILKGEKLEDAVAKVDEDRQDVIALINNFHKKIQGVPHNAIKSEIASDSKFKKKVKFIKVFLETMIDIKKAAADQVEGKGVQPFIPKDPKKTATIPQTWFLAGLLSKLPSAPKEIIQRNRVQKYFQSKVDSNELTQGKVYEISKYVYDNSKVPEDILRDIEELTD